jgi:ABC-type bacteriocin/lantibiotic exporter with double-glycine peptidase domain
MNNYNLESIREKTGYYFPEHEIFTGTVLENITLGRQDLTQKKIIAIAERLGVGNILLNLPFGFDTKIDPIGKKLTKSITHKIVLLRALCHSPSLIILEEPWNGLEESYKDPISNYLIDAKSQSTIIVSSNDIDFANKCDAKYIIKNGELVLLS